MQFASIFVLLLAFALNAMAVAVPAFTTVKKSSTGFAKRDDPNAFSINITNKCGWSKEFILTQGQNYVNVPMSEPLNLPANGGTGTLWADFYWQTMRLSGHGEWSMSQQDSQSQALFEFGYSKMNNGVDGTSYNLSLDPGSDANIGVGVWPENNQCESKICWPWNCQADQGFTQFGDQPGDPAVTVCYQGKVNFDITFCP